MEFQRYFDSSEMRATSNELAVSNPFQSKKFSVNMKANTQRKSYSSQKQVIMPSKVLDKVSVMAVVTSSKSVKSKGILDKAFPQWKGGFSSGKGFSFAKERFDPNSVRMKPRRSTPSKDGCYRIKAVPLKERISNIRLKLPETSSRNNRSSSSSKSNSPYTAGTSKPKLLTNSVSHLTKQLKRKDNEIRKLKQKLWLKDPSVRFPITSTYPKDDVGGSFNGINLDKVTENDYDIVKAKLERLSNEIALKEKKIALKETEVLLLTKANSKIKEELETISKVLADAEERKNEINLKMDTLINEKDEVMIALQNDKYTLEHECAQLRADKSDMQDQVDYITNDINCRQSPKRCRSNNTILQQETKEFLKRIGNLCLSENDKLRVTARCNGNSVKLQLKVKISKGISDCDSRYVSFADTLFEDSRVDNSFMDSTQNTCNNTRFVSFSDTFQDF